jgi:hypothetical protein
MHTRAAWDQQVHHIGAPHTAIPHTSNDWVLYRRSVHVKHRTLRRPSTRRLPMLTSVATVYTQ